MSSKNDLGLAYHMGYEDALAKRKPDASKAQVLASDDLAAENVRLRELCADMLMCLTWTDEPHGYMEDGCGYCRFKGKMHGACGLKRFRGRSSELGVEVDK